MIENDIIIFFQTCPLECPPMSLPPVDYYILSRAIDSKKEDACINQLNLF